MFWVAIVSRSLLCVLLLVPLVVVGQESDSRSLQQQINNTLYRLPLEHQGQYALMLYRTTGNKDYLETARVTLYLSADRLQRFSRNLRNFKARQELVIQEGFLLPSDIIESHSDYFFYGFMVLPELNRINHFAMALKGEAGDKLYQAVNAYDFKEGLTSPGLISHCAPTLAEHVYALLNLDYGDYRITFIEALKQYYPDSSDADLPREHLLNKWKAMVHLVIAASDQLQEPVNDSLLNWIPEYFLHNKQLVLEQGDPEAFAKIGLVLHLTGHDDATLLEAITNKISAISTKQITEDNLFWITLLLEWQKHYFPDPAIYRMSRFKNKVPFSLEPVN